MLPPPLAHPPSDGKRYFQGLFIVQTRIDLAGIGPAEVGLAEPAGAPNAFGNVFAGQLNMHPPEVRAELVMHIERL